MKPAAFETLNPSKRTAADLRLKPRGQRDQHSYVTLFILKGFLEEDFHKPTRMRDPA
jgi:hypothetical protein